MGYYSQFGEDQWIIENLIRSGGVFCDVGAYDGISGSNTLALEQRGWTGVCIEPNAEMANLCRANRDKSKCQVIQAAVGDERALVPFFIPDDKGRGSLFGPGQATAVVMLPLRDILQICGIGHVHLLSIDTEGTELDVWDSLPNIRPEIVIMEYLTWGSPPRNQHICDRMGADGYKVVRCTEANLIFTHV